MTGEEGLDERWGNTPVINIQKIQVLEHAVNHLFAELVERVDDLADGDVAADGGGIPGEAQQEK